MERENFLRVLFDTNIYGLIAEEESSGELVDKIAESSLLVCGSTIIRKELRDTPKYMLVRGTNLRGFLLGSYNLLVADKRNYSVNKIVEKIAKEYYNNYTGKGSWKEIKNDFLIVAIATLHEIKIIVSNDKKTMTSKQAMKAYNLVNKKFELYKPEFIKFEKLKNLV